MIRIIIDNLFYMGISAAVFSLLLLLITWISRRRLSSRLYLAGWITALAMLVIPVYAIASMAGFSFSGVLGDRTSNSQAAQYRAAYSEYMEKSVFPAVKDEAIAGSEENAVQPSGTIGTARAAGQVNNADASSPAEYGAANTNGIEADGKAGAAADKADQEDTSAKTVDISAGHTVAAAGLPAAVKAPSLCDVLFAVWAFGVIVIGALKFLRYFRFRKRILKNSAPGDAEWVALLPEKIHRNLRVREAKVPSPVVFGIFHPTVIIPKRDLSDASMRYALMHEGLHILRKDLLLRTIAEAVAVLNWINPFAWLIRNKVTQYSENSCDEEVVTDLSSEERKKYAMSILDFMDASNDSDPAYPATLMSFTGEAKNLKRRLKHIMEFKMMRKRAILLSCCVVAAAALIGVLAACSLAFPGSTDVGDESAAEETTAAMETTGAATDTTAAPVETTAETTAPAPTQAPVPEGASYLRNTTGYVLSSMESVYLLSEQEVTVVDAHVSDGITQSENDEKIVLPAGTVAVPLDTTGSVAMDLAKDTIFMLNDGRCVVFDVTEGSDGTLLFNGQKQEDLLGQYVYPEYPAAKTEKAEGELRASEAQDPTVSYKVLTIKTDWNGDGVEDTFRRDRAKANSNSDGVLTFTDGATGKVTDVTKYCASDDSGVISALTDRAYFYEDKAGNRVILDTFDVCSSDYMTFAYSYDPTTILAYQEVGGYLTVENGSLYLIRDSVVFGNLEAMLVPASIADNVLTAQDIGTKIWWTANREAGKDPSAVPPVYTCTLQDFAAEKITGDVVEPVTVPAGSAVFPLYTIMDESGAGVFYFRTIADGDCQANFTLADDGYYVMFGQTSQNDLFWCGWGD